MLIDIELMARSGGIRVLLHSMAEGPLEMAPLIASAFLYIVDSPRTRVFLHAGTDLEVMPTLACLLLCWLMFYADRSLWGNGCLWERR